MLPVQVGVSAGLGRGSAQLAPLGASPGECGTQVGARCNASTGVGGTPPSSVEDIRRVRVSSGLDLASVPLDREF